MTHFANRTLILGSIVAIGFMMPLQDVIAVQDTASGVRPAPAAKAPATPDRRDAAPLRGPLAGPRLHDAEAPGVSLRFGGADGLPRERANLRLYMQALGELELTAQQREQIRAIAGRRAELMRQSAGRDGRMGPRDTDIVTDRAPAMDGAERPDAQQRPMDRRRPDNAVAQPLRTDRAAPDGAPAKRPGDMDRRPDRPQVAPKRGPKGEPGMALTRGGRRADEAFMIEIWNVLTPEQQSAFESNLKGIAERQYLERQMRRRRDGAIEPGMMDAMMAEEMKRTEADLGELTPRERRLIERFRTQRRHIEEQRRQGAPRPPKSQELKIGEDGKVEERARPDESSPGEDG